MVECFPILALFWNPFELFVGCLLSFASVYVMGSKGEGSRAKFTKPTLTPDEIQLKKETRKMLNRESARRSRIRKQIQIEQLVISVETLTHENNLLRDELKRLSGKRDKLKSENVSLKEELSKHLETEKLEEVDVYLQYPADKDNN